MTMTILELCKSNSVGGRYADPTVIETWEIPSEDLQDELKAARDRLLPGYFVREFRDTTGATD
jgi:hypothetical protein